MDEEQKKRWKNPQLSMIEGADLLRKKSYSRYALPAFPRENQLAILEGERSRRAAIKLISLPPNTAAQTRQPPAFTESALEKKPPLQWQSLARSMEIKDLSLGPALMPPVEEAQRADNHHLQRIQMALFLNAIALRYKLPNIKPRQRSDAPLRHAILERDAKVMAVATSPQELEIFHEAAKGSPIPLLAFAPGVIKPDVSSELLLQIDDRIRWVPCTADDRSELERNCRNFKQETGGHIYPNDGQDGLQISRWLNAGLPLLEGIESYFNRSFRDSVPPSHIFLGKASESSLQATAHALWLAFDRHRPVLIVVEDAQAPVIYSKASDEKIDRSLLEDFEQGLHKEKTIPLMKQAIEKMAADFIVKLESSLIEEAALVAREFESLQERPGFERGKTGSLHAALAGAIALCQHGDLRERAQIIPDSRFLILGD